MEDPFPDSTETNVMIKRASVSAAEKENLHDSVERNPSLNIACQVGETSSYCVNAAHIRRLIDKEFFRRRGMLGQLDVSFLSSMDRNLIFLVSTKLQLEKLPKYDPPRSCTSVSCGLSVAIYKFQLNTWITNFPDDELEELMVEEIIWQTIGRAKKSGLSVPESETTEALLNSPGD
ncbi:hypothetical protein Q9L58_010413 [Maublancomyces gigas]|uniref:Uncharacterized protein n=1 Tax=Discina gigas TaxID=1032678 RepID=A0ABR3G4E2_9PEZI